MRDGRMDRRTDGQTEWNQYTPLNIFVVPLRCSWSITYWRRFNYIFILDLKPGFNGLGKDNNKTRQETFKFWDLVQFILEVWQFLYLVKAQWLPILEQDLTTLNLLNNQISWIDEKNYIETGP